MSLFILVLWFAMLKASLAYGSWPLPFNDLVPHTEQDWVQFAHRGMALITFVGL